MFNYKQPNQSVVQSSIGGEQTILAQMALIRSVNLNNLFQPTVTLVQCQFTITNLPSIHSQPGGKEAVRLGN